MSDKDKQRMVAAEDRADVAEEFTHTAHAIAARLDRLNHHLTIENKKMRDALKALAQAIEEILIVVEDNEIQGRVRTAIEAARIAFEGDE